VSHLKARSGQVEPQIVVLQEATVAPRRGTRAVPQRQDALSHLDLPSLRALRANLTNEENHVSYWRRLVQARVDTLRAAAGEPLSAHRLRQVLGGNATTIQRKALPSLGLLGDCPPLPELDALWEQTGGGQDPAATTALLANLDKAETELSAYRTRLHSELARVTEDLLARYRADPELCLSILPMRPGD